MFNGNSTLSTAIVRGFWAGFVAAGGTFFATLAASDDVNVAAIAAGSAFFMTLGFRGGVEGQYDATRDKTGDLLPGDVGQPNR